MKQPPKTEATIARNATVLSVSPISDDHISLKQIIHYFELGVHSDSRWEMNESLTLTSAVSVLWQQQISVVICERDLQPGTWKGAGAGRMSAQSAASYRNFPAGG